MAGKQHSRALSSAHGTLDTAPERGEHTRIRNDKLLPAPRTQGRVQIRQRWQVPIWVCSWEALPDLQVILKASEQLWHLQPAPLGYVIISSFRDRG